MTRVDPRAERGAVAVIVAFTLPALLALAAIVLDLGNQWAHKRHLQAQADAAALAGAQLMRGPCNDAIESQIATEADKYAGTTSTLNSTAFSTTPSAVRLNNQLDVPQGNEQILGLLNSPNYPDDQGGPGNGETNSGHPCKDGAVDVKLTDKAVPFLAAGGIPLLSSALSSFGHINVHARVAIKQIASETGLLPYAVPDPTPKQVQARLYDDSGTNLGDTATTPIPLTQADPTNDPYTFTGQWTGPLPSTRYAAANVQLMTSGSSAPISSGCSGALEQCFPPVGNAATGLVQSRVWAATADTPGTNDVALFYDVRFSPSGAPGCGSDGYFARVTSANCTVNVSVDADFKSGIGYPPNTNPPTPPTATDSAVVCMATSTAAWPTQPGRNSPGCGNNAVRLQYAGQDPANPPHQLWTGSFGNIDMETQTGGATFVTIWPVAHSGSVGGNACGTGNNACMGPAVHAQQFFSGTQTLSGSLDAVSIVSNSRQPCSGCQTTFTITAHFKPLRPAQSPTDPKFYLRVASSQNNQTVNCNPNGSGSNLQSQISGGCSLTFRKWAPSDPLCNPNPVMTYTYMQGPPVNAPPYPCVQVGTGVTAGQVGQGMAERVFCGGTAGPGNPICPSNNPSFKTCPDQYRNHWPSDPNATLPDFKSLHDNRLMPVFIVRYGEFANAQNGSQLYLPILDFGEFYVTGWTGNSGSKSDPCVFDPTQPLPPGASYDDDTSSNGTVIGHFVGEVVDNLPPSDANCDFNSLTPCVAVLVD